ncbi:MAG: hypothetical protein HY909_04590 [Deltaproteobacteria bacterium]|nr:hypothetical protein [Deltaproteobacteria bacterium]
MVRSLAALFLVGCAAGPVEPRGDPPTDGGGFFPVLDGSTVQCRGNRDGVLQRDEVLFAPGVEVRYRVNPSGTVARVDTRGSAQANGTRAWDFSDPAGELVPLSLVESRGQWFEASFPSARYAARLDPRAPALGVYAVDEREVRLLGVAGATSMVGTLVRYDNPIALLRFPLALGMTWTAEATTVDATVEHAPVASRDRYEVTVDAVGSVRLPAITFAQALRVRVEVTQRFPAGPGTRRIQYLWLAECYGEVARTTSRDGELEPDYREAQEFRRLGL